MPEVLQADMTRRWRFDVVLVTRPLKTNRPQTSGLVKWLAGYMTSWIGVAINSPWPAMPH
jgi:hypothetical protein